MQKYYHGLGRKGPYFEGWYVRLQTKDGRALALIPAYHRDQEGQGSTSLQVITGDGTWCVDYPESVFRAKPERFFVRLGRNLFTDHGVSLSVETEGLTLAGNLQFGPLSPLHSDIMGPFRFLGEMECTHGVLSMCHSVTGTLCWNGCTVDFSGGLGYLETDRGRSFPQEYLWSQCAWLDGGQNGVMLAVAQIPLGKLNFTGCISAVQYQGRQYTLTTYQGAKILRWSAQGAILQQGDFRLEATLLQDHGHSLQAPDDGKMTRTVRESVDAMVQYRFWEGQSLIFCREALCAGFEADCHQAT